MGNGEMGIVRQRNEMRYIRETAVRNSLLALLVVALSCTGKQ